MNKARMQVLQFPSDRNKFQRSYNGDKKAKGKKRSVQYEYRHREKMRQDQLTVERNF